MTTYENAKPIGSRIIVRQAARKATKVRTQQAISLRLRKKTGPEDLARASKAITKIARERLLTTERLMPFNMCLSLCQALKRQVLKKRGIHAD